MPAKVARALPARIVPVLPALRTLAARLALLALLPLAASAAGAANPTGFRYWDPGDTTTIPPTLSAMGVYQGTPGKNAPLVTQAKYFDVNSPLWSDDAKKKRWVIVKPGKSIGFRTLDDYWTYPESTVFVKEFAIDTVPGDTNTRVLWETRILYMKREGMDSVDGRAIMSDTWYGYSYKWDADQKDARLVRAKGLEDQIRFYPEGLGKPARMKKWVFPRRTECDRCHISRQSENVHGRSVLGFFTAQLNRPAPKSPGMNQLDWLISQGVLSGTKPASWDASPRWRGIEDSAFTSDKWTSLDVRARSYLGANCSGCHGDRGGELSAYLSRDFNYDFYDMASRIEFRNHDVGWGHGADANAPEFWPKTDRVNNPLGMDSLPITSKLIIAGYPSKSALLQRQKNRNTEPDDFGTVDQMPPLATYEVNTAAIALLEKWILAMPPLPPSAVRRPPSVPTAGAGYAVRVQGRRVEITRGRGTGSAKGTVTGDGSGPGAGAEEVSLVSVDGRRMPLRPLGDGSYELPTDLGRGVFFIRVGGRSFVRYRF